MDITNDTIVLASTDPPQVWDFYGSRIYAGIKQGEANAYNLKLEQYGAPRRTYEIMTYGEYKAAERAFYLKDPPAEITKEKFIEMLEVLPPKAWRSEGTFESFLMSEHWSGPYTEQYARYGRKYYSKTVDSTDKATWMTPDSLQMAHMERRIKSL